MDSEARKQFMRQLMEFLRNKMRSPDVSGDVVVHRNEVEELAESVGMDAEEGWQTFKGLKGRNRAWEGQYMPVWSDERGYLGARLTWVDPGP
jgi:hypothetical protein